MKNLSYQSKTIILIGIIIISNIQPSFAQNCKDLCIAIQNGDLTQAKILMDQGLSLNCEYTYKFTPQHNNPHFQTRSHSTTIVQSPIHFIAKAALDYEVLIAFFKDNNIDLNTKDSQQKTLLHLAAASKNEALIELLLNENIDINAIDHKKNTVLTLLLESQTTIALVEKFIAKKGQVYQTKDRNSALYNAFKYNRPDIAELLLKHGAKITETNPQGHTCLDAAIENQNLDLIQLAFKHGANPRPVSMKHLTNEEIIKLLIQKGAQPNQVDLNNIIVYTNNTTFVKWLVEQGADPNQKGFLKQTPLYHAIKKDNLEIVQLLVKAGAKVTHQLNENENYLTTATLQPQVNSAIIQYLIQQGVPSWGMNKALRQLIETENIDGIKALTQNGFNINKATIEKVNNPKFAEQLIGLGANIKNFDLESIIEGGNVKMIQYLKQKEVNLDARNAIYIAVAQKQIAILGYLLKENYNPNLSYQEGKWHYTPLMKAVQNNHLTAIQLLIENGANLNTMNDKGETVLQLAILSSNEQVLDYLLKKEIDFSSPQKKPQVNLLVKTCIEHNLIQVLQKLSENGLKIQLISLCDFLDDDNKEAIEILINQGVDVSTPNINGEKPLFLAFKKRYYKTVNLLLKKGANINDICLAELMEKQIRLDFFAIKFLVEEGIELNTACNAENTPLQIAIQKDDFKMVKFLIKNGADTQNNKAYKYAKKLKATDTIIQYLKDNKQQ